MKQNDQLRHDLINLINDNNDLKLKIKIILADKETKEKYDIECFETKIMKEKEDYQSSVELINKHNKKLENSIIEQELNINKLKDELDISNDKAKDYDELNKKF